LLRRRGLTDRAISRIVDLQRYRYENHFLNEIRENIFFIQVKRCHPQNKQLNDWIRSELMNGGFPKAKKLV
jgi:hypothetical protein